jgi:hypothetical protein
VRAAQADAALARQNLTRGQELFERGFYPRARLDSDVAADNAAQDGTKIGVSDFNGRMGLFVTSSGTSSVGMLGSPDGDPTNDWVTRGGEVLDSEIRFDFDAFYPTYFDTWRITQEESLFHYEPGETTESLTIDGFPRSQFAVGDFDPAVVENAEEACVKGGIEDPGMLEDCIMDVVVTGDRSFTYDIYQAQSLTSQPSPSTTVTENPPSVAGDTFVTVGAFALEFGPNPPKLAPNTTAFWSCTADDGTFHADGRFTDTEGRRFDFFINYISVERSTIGRDEFLMVIKLNDEQYVWHLPTDGSEAWTLDSI